MGRPEFAEYQSKRADALGRLGRTRYAIQGRVEEAKTTLLQALDLEDRLAGEHPEVRAYRESLATILLYFAGLQEDKLHDIPGGIASHQRAAEIMEKLARDHPGATKYQLSLGFILATLGHVFAGASELFPQAEAAVQRSIAILEKLAAEPS